MASLYLTQDEQDQINEAIAASGGSPSTDSALQYQQPAQPQYAPSPSYDAQQPYGAAPYDPYQQPVQQWDQPADLQSAWDQSPYPSYSQPVSDWNQPVGLGQSYQDQQWNDQRRYADAMQWLSPLPWDQPSQSDAALRLQQVQGFPVTQIGARDPNSVPLDYSQPEWAQNHYANPWEQQQVDEQLGTPGLVQGVGNAFQLGHLPYLAGAGALNQALHGENPFGGSFNDTLNAGANVDEAVPSWAQPYYQAGTNVFSYMGGLGLRQALALGGAAAGQQATAQFTDNPWVQQAGMLAGGLFGHQAPEIGGALGRGAMAAGDAITPTLRAINEGEAGELTLRRGGQEETPKNLPDGRINPDWVQEQSLARGTHAVTADGEVVRVTDNFDPMHARKVQTDVGPMARDALIVPGSQAELEQYIALKNEATRLGIDTAKLARAVATGADEIPGVEGSAPAIRRLRSIKGNMQPINPENPGPTMPMDLFGEGDQALAGATQYDAAAFKAKQAQMEAESAGRRAAWEADVQARRGEGTNTSGPFPAREASHQPSLTGDMFEPPSVVNPEGLPATRLMTPGESAAYPPAITRAERVGLSSATDTRGPFPQGIPEPEGAQRSLLGTEGEGGLFPESPSIPPEATGRPMPSPERASPQAVAELRDLVAWREEWLGRTQIDGDPIAVRQAQESLAEARQAYAYARRGVPEPRYGGEGSGTSGPEMRTTADSGKPQDLVLRPQTVADADLGVVPVPGERSSVALARAADASESFRARAGRAVTDVINLPRAIKAGLDMSATLRQALPLGAGHPFAFGKALAAQVRSIAREGDYQDLLTSIHQAPLASLRQKAGLFLASAEGDASLGAREEQFLTRLAGKLPGLKQTERGYVAMLDKLRSDVFDSTVERWMRQGYSPSETDVRNLSEFINHATGRGTGSFLARVGSSPSLAFFSPRYLASRPQLIADLAMRGGPVRAEVARSLVSWLGGIAALDAIAVASGVGGVQLNPLSGGFGKLQVGRQSYDLSGGLTGDVRTLAQTLAGSRLNGAGVDVPANRLDTLGQYVRGKLSPTASLVIDALKGEDYNGNSIDWGKLTGKGTGGAELMNTFGNLFAGDVAKAAQVEFRNGVSASNILRLAGNATLAFLGATVQTDNSDFTDRAEAISDYSRAQGWLDASGKPIASRSQLNAEQKRVLDAAIGRPQFNTESAKGQQIAVAQAQRSTETAKQAQEYQTSVQNAAAKFQNGQMDGAQFRDALQTAGDARRGERDALDRLLPYPPAATPEDRAVGDWYNLTNLPGVRINGKVDQGELALAQAEFIRGIDPKTLDYLQRAVSGTPSSQIPDAAREAIAASGGKPPEPENPTVAGMFADIKQIADSGFWDSRSKERFLEQHRELVPVLAKWGYAEVTRNALAAYDKSAASQAADDNVLADKGYAYSKTWRENLFDRQDALRNQLDGIYAGSTGPDSRPTDAPARAVARYFDMRDSLAAAHPESPKLTDDDRTALDRFLAENGDVQSALDSLDKRQVSASVQQYRDDQKAIDASYYWAVGDRIATRFAQKYGLPENITTSGELTGYLQDQIHARLIQRGMNERDATNLAVNITADALDKEVTSPTSDLRAYIRNSTKGLPDLLVKWGYWSPGKKDTAALIAGAPLGKR